MSRATRPSSEQTLKVAATRACVTKAQRIRKNLAGRGKSDEHKRSALGMSYAGPRAIPADG
jgi:hypothetical protein